MYEFIDGEKANYPITKMCAWIGVSRSGFYEWRGRPASATFERRAALTVVVREVFDDYDGTYGHRRVHAQLGREGVDAGVELVRSIMRAEGLVACQPRPYRATTTPDAAAAATADLVARDFTADAPGVKLVGDITYIPTWQGWLYLATVIDCHTKAVVGWSMAAHMHASLVTDAIGMAAGNIALQDGCVFHSAWAVDDADCTIINQSFHRTAEATGSGLSYDDIYKDWLTLTYPWPLVVQAAGNTGESGATINPPTDEYVNHKAYNHLTVGNHSDDASSMSSTTVFRNPATAHGDRELPELRPTARR